MTSSPDLLIDAGVFVGPDSVEQARTIRVQDGTITAIGGTEDFGDGGGAQRLGGPTTMALPGFVNAHQHGMPHGLTMIGIPDGPLEPWMFELLAAPGVAPYDAARRVAARQLRAGITTTVHHQYTFATSAEEYDAEIRSYLEGYRDGGLRVVFAADVKDRGEPVHFEDDFLNGLPPDLGAWAQGLRVQLPDFARLMEVLNGIRADIAAGTYGDAELILGPSGPVWCSDEMMAAVARAAEAEGMNVTSHVLESPYEKVFGLRAYPGKGTVVGLDELGVLGPGFFLSHGCQLDQADAELLAARGASVVTNPGSNLRLHNGVAPVTMLLDAGVNVAIGTDSLSIGDRDEIVNELRLVQALQRLPRADVPSLGPNVLMKMLTENGARVTGVDRVGSLKVGGSADLVLVDLEQIVVPGAVADPVAAFIGVAEPADFTEVISQGRVVAERGVMTEPTKNPTCTPVSGERAALVAELLPYARAYYQAIPLAG